MTRPDLHSGGVNASSAPENVQPIFWKHRADPQLAVIAARPGDGARAILTEIKVCVEQLLAHGRASAIDLRFLRLMPEERATLALLLGRGEVSAVIESIGRSEVIETAVPCVWWVRHFNTDGETVGELIEITDIPELLTGDRDAAVPALEALCAQFVPIIAAEVHQRQS